MTDPTKNEQEAQQPMSPELRQSEPTWRIMLNKLDWTIRILIIGLILFLFYMAYMTEYVPNTTYYTNITDEYNYSSLVKIPAYNVSQYDNIVTIVQYKPNDFVPKQGITYNYSMIAAIWLIVIILYLLSKLFLRNAMLTERQAKEILQKELDHKKYVLKDPELDGQIQVGPAVVLKRYQKNESERVPDVYVIGVKIVDKDEVEYFYVGMVHTISGYIYGILPRQTEFVAEDICGNCGKYPWVTKIIDTDSFAIFRRKMRGMSGQGGGEQR